MKTYDKLVRDNIPQIITQSGKCCQTRTLSREEFVAALRAKLSEEVGEYFASGATEELADVMEVVYALAQTAGVSQAGLENIRLSKAQIRGGFSNRIFLQTVSDDEE